MSCKTCNNCQHSAGSPQNQQLLANLLTASSASLNSRKVKGKNLQQLKNVINRKETERIRTLVMIKGWLKSIPPESLNPQGAGPWRTTFCGIVDVFFFPGLLSFFPQVCVRSQAVGGRVLSAEHLPDGAADPTHLLGTFTRPTAAGTALIPAFWVTSASPSASPPTEGSTGLGQIKPECWKVYNKYLSFICCCSVPSA